MSTIYTLFKFLHIVGAIGWIGGLVTFGLLSARFAREQDQAVLEALTRLMRVNGMAIIGPSSGLTLIAGIVMIAVSELGVPLWVIWGFSAIVVSVVLGVTLIGRTSKELREVAGAAEPGQLRMSTLQRRLVALNIVNVLVLLSAVWAMVFKPAL
jgi:uncharacterized membrane protein